VTGSSRTGDTFPVVDNVGRMAFASATEFVGDETIITLELTGVGFGLTFWCGEGDGVGWVVTFYFGFVDVDLVSDERLDSSSTVSLCSALCSGVLPNEDVDGGKTDTSVDAAELMTVDIEV